MLSIILRNKLFFIAFLILSGCAKNASERCFCDTFQLFDVNPNNIVLNCYRGGDLFKLEESKSSKILSRNNISNPRRNYEKLLILNDTISMSKSTFVKVINKSDSIIFCLISQEPCDSINIEIFKKDVILINKTYNGNQFTISKKKYDSVKSFSIMLEIYYKNRNPQELAKYIPAVKEAIDRGEDPKVTSTATYSYSKLEAIVENNIESVYSEMKKCRELAK